MMRLTRIVLAVAIALLLGVGCTWLKRSVYEGFDRDQWQQPDRVIQTLAIQPGENIADLGAGSGYFTFRMADAAGPGGKVYAADIDAPMIDFLKKEIEKRGYKNVETIMGDPSDPKLPEDGINLIFLCNVYHHLENQVAYFKNLKKSLRPVGRIAIIDFQDGFHSTPWEKIQNAMIEAGYTLQAKHDYLKKQNFQVFTANP